jgi:ribonuclease HII
LSGAQGTERRFRGLGDLDRELLLCASDLIGIDEVGRGCLAGPVVAAAVRFNRIPDLPGVRDSKTLTSRQRERAAGAIRETCSGWTAVEVWPVLIDRLNILQATRVAMTAAAGRLAGTGSKVVVDAVELLDADLDAQSPKAADASFFVVAAASILAKVHRDRLMSELADRHRPWGWQRNKGYGTLEHRRALTEHGRSHLHRRSFSWAPVLP